MADVKQVSEALASVVERMGPSLVRLDARRRFGTSGVAYREDGYLVASAHAVERQGEIGVTLPDGEELQAKPVGRDPATDLAVLKVEATLQTPRWREATGLKVGHLALAVSRPGKTVRARLGVVSVLGEGLSTAWGGRIEPYLETDIGPHPGFSGSVLADVEGNALGVNTIGVLRGASVAVPYATVKKVADQLVLHGKIRRGYLGLGLHPVRLPEPLKREAGTEGGLVVLAVEPGGPAAGAGIAMGDTLIEVAGGPVDDLSELWSRLGDDTIGEDVNVKFLRGGKPQLVVVTVGERP